jgi:hypothetical protein
MPDQKQGDSSLIPIRDWGVLILFRLKPLNELRFTYHVFNVVGVILIVSYHVLSDKVLFSSANKTLFYFYLLYILSLVQSFWLIYRSPSLASAFKHKDYTAFRKSGYHLTCSFFMALSIIIPLFKIIYSEISSSELLFITLVWNIIYLSSIDSFFYLNHKFSKSNNGL